MSNEEWWAKIEEIYNHPNAKWILGDALRAVVELHKPILVMGLVYQCDVCRIPPDDEHNYSSPSSYPCETIEAIEKELK